MSEPIIITPDNAQKVLVNAAVTFSNSFDENDGDANVGNEDKRGNEGQRLLEILQTSDSNVREVFAACVNKEGVRRAFTRASSDNDVELLQAIHAIGMNVDVEDEFGNSALINASWLGKEKSVRWLLDHGANVDIQDDSGNTSLLFASRRGYTDIVEMLLQKNVKSDLQDNLGRTALMLAAASGHNEVAQLLLNHGAVIDLKDNQGQTALDLAVTEEIREMLRNHVSSSYVLK
jgi:ankyrin repeat protein